MNTCNAEHQQLVAKLQAAAEQLAPSERRVVDAMHARLAGGWPLTTYQATRLAELWDRITEKGVAPMDPNMHDDDELPMRFASLDLCGHPIDIGIQGYAKMVRPIVDGLAAKFPPEAREQFIAGMLTGLLSTAVCTIGRDKTAALARDCTRIVESVPDELWQQCKPGKEG